MLQFSEGINLEVVPYWTESRPCQAYHEKRSSRTKPGRPEWFGDTEMEITAIGMGLMMTGVAVAVGGLTLEATLLMMCRALRAPPLAASSEIAAIHLS